MTVRRSSNVRVVGLTVVLGACALAACHFTIEPLVVPLVDASVPDDMRSDDLPDGAQLDLPEPDLAGLCMPGGPTSGCSDDGTSLLTCQGTTPVPTKCDDGCGVSPAPHCQRLDPGGVAEPTDYELPALADIVISDDAVFNTDTGAITANGIDRTGGVGVQVGIGFRNPSQPGASAVGIFSVKSLTVAQSGSIRVVGSVPLVLVASGSIVLNGGIDGQGSCSTAAGVGGGGAGGTPAIGSGGKGGGLGGGGGGQLVLTGGGGGGGGGFGDVGGAGGGTGTNTNAGGAAGPLFGDYTVSDPILTGGGGGGAGGGVVAGGTGGAGGAGVQIVSNTAIVVGNKAVLQVGGCHGAKSGGSGGGGGGAGGVLFLESRTVTIAAGATLAANGGGGGGGNGTKGNDASPDVDEAQGGNGGGMGTAGGNGGHTTSLMGESVGTPQAGDTTGGGGGGAVGRIVLKSKSGVVSTAGVIMSPKIGEMTPGRPAPGIVGTIHFH